LKSDKYDIDWYIKADTELEIFGIDGCSGDVYLVQWAASCITKPFGVRSEEVYNAFLKAKAAGKVGYFGMSTHKNAQKVLEAAIETGWYDLAVIGITPAGWYIGHPNDVLAFQTLEDAYDCKLLVDESPLGQFPRVTLVPQKLLK